VPIVRSKLADVKRTAALALLCLAVALPPASDGRAQELAGPAETALKALLANSAVAKALEQIKADDARTLAEQRRITEIAAPPFKEHTRAEYFLQRFHELGLNDAALDGEGNVVALRKGSGKGPKLVVSGHLDTVFPEDTDVTVREADGVLRAPGIGDDARGLAALLSVIQTLNANAITTAGDVMLVGTVGEEELGNLRGVKALFRDHRDIDGFISIDGLGITRVVNRATGSLRYEMIFRGPGGHSFQEFGLPSAIHAMGRAVAGIADLGTSVNAIAGEAHMTVDLRSNATEELLKLKARVLALVSEAAAEENKRWGSDRITVEINLIGERPAGVVAEDSPLVEAARRSAAAIAREPHVVFAGASTDSNLAMSLGIPAVTIGGGGEGGNWHSLNEWYRPTDAYLGPQNALLTLLMLAGMEGVSAPVLPRRAAR
jgi:acetylornithine deacetylase/succinyl-diaminopimelate desuccinylase-like protein